MIYILSMKELDKEKRKEAQRRLFSYAVFQKGWKASGIREVTYEELPEEDCNVKILRSEHGKPYVEGNPWYFNTSHSGDYLVMVFDTLPVGIDVQEMRPVRKPELIAKRFSKEERAYALSKGLEAFYEIWCRKEAFAKCVGRGLTDEIFARNLLEGVEGYAFEDGFVLKSYGLCVCRVQNSRLDSSTKD